MDSKDEDDYDYLFKGESFRYKYRIKRTGWENFSLAYTNFFLHLTVYSSL